MKRPSKTLTSFRAMSMDDAKAMALVMTDALGTLVVAGNVADLFPEGSVTREMGWFSVAVAASHLRAAEMFLAGVAHGRRMRY